jgi:hypothetical protein
MGVRAFTINSENKDDWSAVEAALKRNVVDILLISPERLANQTFLTEVLGPVAGRISMLVVDEAHCISDCPRRSQHQELASHHLLWRYQPAVEKDQNLGSIIARVQQTFSLVCRPSGWTGKTDRTCTALSRGDDIGMR